MAKGVISCFPQLRIPNEFPSTVLEHAENWRMLDKWANPLIGGCENPARASAGDFNGILNPSPGAGDDVVFNDTVLSFGGAYQSAGGASIDTTTGAITLPNAGFYISMVQLEITDVEGADPYWTQWLAPSGDFKLTYLDAPMSSTQIFYSAAGGTVFFGLRNNGTSASHVTYINAVYFVCEIPGSSLT